MCNASSRMNLIYFLTIELENKRSGGFRGYVINQC